MYSRSLLLVIILQHDPLALLPSSMHDHQGSKDRPHAWYRISYCGNCRSEVKTSDKNSPSAMASPTRAYTHFSTWTSDSGGMMQALEEVSQLYYMHLASRPDAY